MMNCLQYGKMGVLLLVFFAASPLTQASYDYKFDNRQVKTGQFESEISGKLSRGITNTAFGWTEIVETPVQWADDTSHGFWQAMTLGIPYGITRAAGRTLVGVYEIATCYAPQKPIFPDIQGNAV